MVGAIINRNVLKSQMALQDMNVKDIAKALKWSKTTAYRKVNGKVAFTAPEIQACVELLSLDTNTANLIFFCRENVLKDNE